MCLYVRIRIRVDTALRMWNLNKLGRHSLCIAGDELAIVIKLLCYESVLVRFIKCVVRKPCLTWIILIS